MRTIRTKVYKFNELNQQAQCNAIHNEVRRFDSYFSVDSKATNEAKIAAKKRIEAYEYEFTSNGKMI